MRSEVVFDPASDAWRCWLEALATDADAALAAALAYESLDDAGRHGWLDALQEDAPRLSVPPMALYAPLLAVERDEARRTRIVSALGAEGVGARAASALVAGARNERVCVIAMPLYLSFVEVLVCRYGPDSGVASAQHEPLRHEREVGSLVPDLTLAPAAVAQVVDELAHAVLADRREGRSAPRALTAFAYLFGLHYAGWDHAA